MAQCMFPYHVENKVFHSQAERYVPVPCGKCPDCLKRRSSIWGFRLKKEEERSDSALFVTLTYDSLFVPLTKNNMMTLDKTDVQKFFKRLRKLKWQHSPNGKSIKYYCAGEYGSTTKRPHYHLIIFNSSEIDILKAWIHPEKNIPLGHVDIGTVTGASIGYTIKYINKGTWKPLHHNDHRQPEFALMSKKMGENYLTKATINYHRSDLSKAYLTLEDGIKMAIPRYYKNRLFPTELSPTQRHEELINSFPILLTHLEDNKILVKQQNNIVKELIENQPKDTRSDREIHESKRQTIENFQKLHSKRKN